MNYPLSHAQQRLWFLDRYQPGTATYNACKVFRLRGALNVDALSAAFNEVVRRHSVLRTRITSHRGVAGQSIIESVHIPLSVVDLRDARMHEPEDFFRQEARRPFDLECGPMIRTVLYRTAESEYVLLIVVHHIATDGWSMDILWRELKALYTAFVDGRKSPLQPLEAQYMDFVRYQQEWLDQGELQRQLEYWRGELSGIQPLELPTDHPRPAESAYQGGSAERRLSPELSLEFKALAREHGVTLFILLLATFQVLLYRHGGHEDVAVGAPVSNRERKAWQELIGLFVNTVVMRTTLSPEERFSELLRRVGRMAFNAYSRADLPFEKLVEELAPQRDMSRNPLFQAMLSLLMPRNRHSTFAGIESEDLAVDLGVAKFDLALVVADEETGLRLSLVYRTDLFEPATVERLLHRLEVLVCSVVANPAVQVGEIDVLPDAERRRLLIDWNPAAGNPDKVRCVHALFERWVRHTPEAVALSTADGDLGYRELDRRAGALAGHLRASGLAPGDAVGLCIERSPQMVIGILAILKAGGTYVPLDPRFPGERLRLIVEDAAIRIVLSSESSPLIEQLPCDVLGIASGMQYQSADAGAPGSANPSPYDDAYVIFTSGSTGRPKGVPISHAAISANCEVMKACYEIVPEDRVLLFSRFTFDQSLDQILLPLSCGACVVPAPEDLPGPAEFSELLHHQRITVINLPPAYWRQWVQAMAAGQARSVLPRLRLASVGGDVIPVDSVRLWEDLPLSNSARLLNAYGPTEATITTTIFQIDGVPQGHAVPIGRPLPGRLIYILDYLGSLAPIGVPGELCIGGDFLTRGYLNRPELTAEKIMANPFVDHPRARLYRTGDLVRYLPDGDIEFRGRLDFQVKIRGFRIEPGEIEHVLRGHPAVHDAVVVATDDATGEKSLVAYIVTVVDGDPTHELRARLRSTLPEYMMPAMFVPLDTLPLNPYGKVDRQALPLPGLNLREAQEVFSAPVGEVECALATIWRDVLHGERIGRGDSFLELGGNSINAMQVTARLNDTLGIDLPLRIMFDTKNLEELADAVALALQNPSDDAG